MADQNSQFYAILTNVGAAKQANADALGIPWKITQLGIGDANGAEPTPNATQTRLINEWRRAPLNQLKVDDKNNAVIVAEQIIPAEVGGKWIREIALYDADGDMIAVANCPPTFKPLLNQGSGRTQVVRMNLLVSSSANVELKIDPAVVLATREYVDSRVNTRLPLAGGEMTGDIQMTESRVLNMIGDSSASWANGMVFRDKAARNWKGAIGAWGNQNVVNNLFIALGPEPWASGNGMRVYPTKVSFTGPMEGDGSLLWGVRFSALTGLPTTLSGYGVAMASQVEAEQGSDTTKPMSALRVFQAIAAKVLRATMSREGIARFSSQLAADAGEDSDTMISPLTLKGVLGKYLRQAREDDFGVVKLASAVEVAEGNNTEKVVTPKTLAQRLGNFLRQAREDDYGVVRLATLDELVAGTNQEKVVTPGKIRYGVSWLFGARGHFAFPTWLGGMVINWGLETGIPTAVDGAGEVGPVRDVTLSLAFPQEGFGVLATMAFHTMNVRAANAPGAALLSRSVVRLQNNYTASAGAIFWVAFGN
ncbi:hypothetical protein EGT09_08530 [Pseudomonas putida]|uniref:phage tail protein n=1 Tax=Pseudomonas putida TaxID=303 RepID=UPI000F79CF9E|nr:phage tail protein [Pseudomonas putida]RSC26457.1 hypothetical protein EGT09_08530 [Pseudomonas putida]